MIQNVVCFCISSVIRRPTTLCLRTVLMLWRDLPIQAPTRNTRHSSCFSNSSSKTSLFSVFSLAVFRSCGFANQLGPCHQRPVNLLTSPPRLPTSAGFSSVGTCLQLICFSWIFLTRFPTNCLCRHFHGSGPVLPCYPANYKHFLRENPCTRFAAIRPATSSKRGIVSHREGHG